MKLHHFLKAAGKSQRRIALFLGALIFCRVILLIFAPLGDPSESRYAEISRKMVETSNWVTPQFDYGVPFWAKPPLSLWVSALGIEVFGANHFGSRIFIFISALCVLLVVARAAREEFQSIKMGWIAATLLMACPLFFFCSAAVMTDLMLMLGTTLTMVGFRLALEKKSRCWGYLFFIGLVIGLLAKGPLTLVVAGPPIFVYCLITRQWRHVWRQVPWIFGTVLVLVLTLPWYLLAELRTPGFIDYFIVGEHIRRFTVKSWAGDRYGGAHSKPLGMIWAYVLLATFPWCLGLLAAPLRRWRNFQSWAMADNGRGLYWLLWALWPVAFFTPARNIIATYPLPALPAIVLLLTDICNRHERQSQRFHPLHPTLVTVSAVLMVLGMWFLYSLPTNPSISSEINTVKYYLSNKDKGDRLVYYHMRKFSAEFYTAGKIKNTESTEVLLEWMKAPGRLFVAADPRYVTKLPAVTKDKLKLLITWNKKSALYEHCAAVPPQKVIIP